MVHGSLETGCIGDYVLLRTEYVSDIVFLALDSPLHG